MSTAHAFELPSLRGRPIRLAEYADRPLLIVNTASLCGFTPQYEGLQRLWSSYGDRGLLVLGVPSNDFGRQEPGDATSIAAMCDTRFAVTFPMAGKVHVRGPDAAPLFQWISAQAGPWGRPRWNFYKYLIGRDGSLVQWFSSLTRPDSPRLRVAIERCLRPV